MERHLLHHTEGNENAETEEISLIVLSIKKEEKNTNTQINKKSNESLCSSDNDNSIPFCNILLSKFLDLTTENDLTFDKNNVDTRIEAEKCESSPAAQSCFTETKEKKRGEKQKRCRERKKLENYELYVSNERKRQVEAQKRYRERKRLEKLKKKLEKLREVDIEVAINKRKKHAERQKHYRAKKYQDIEVAINERKKHAERQRHYRAKKKMKINELQDAKDIEVEINKRKRNAERQKRYVERKKLENNELYLSNERKKQARKRCKQRQKKKKDEMQDGDEQVDIEVAE